MPDPNIQQFTQAGQLPIFNERQLTKLSKAFQNIEDKKSPLASIFPTEENKARLVRIVRRKEFAGKLFPVVQPGGASPLLTTQIPTFEEMFVRPAYLRAAERFSEYEINALSNPELPEERWEPAKLVAQRIERRVGELSRTFDVFRAKMLLGGISYVDPDTQIAVDAPAGIPRVNLVHYRGTVNDNAAVSTYANLVATTATSVAGYGIGGGRDEVNFFTDINRTAGGVPWSHPYADILVSIRKIVNYLNRTNHVKFDTMVCSGELLEVFMDNLQMRNQAGELVLTGNNFGIAGQGVSTIATALMSGQPIPQLGGLKVVQIDNFYNDPVTGSLTKVWPINKVAFVSTTDEALGYTQYVLGEREDIIGMWTYVGRSNAAELAPSYYVQIANAGLPYVMNPHQLAIVTVGEEADLYQRLGLKSDWEYGINASR
jgi:Phage major capsid protein E